MRSDRLRLQDILDAIEVVAHYLPGDRAAFDRDPPLQSHIYRHVMLVGEAAWRLSQEIKDSLRDHLVQIQQHARQRGVRRQLGFVELRIARRLTNRQQLLRGVGC